MITALTRPRLRVALAAGGACVLAATTWAVLPDSVARAADPFDDAPVGYAAMNGGTDGGFGGDEVTELLLSDYESWSEEDTAGEALYQVLKDHQDASGDGLVVHVDVTVTQRSEEHTSELQSRFDLVCRLLLET